MMTGQTKVSHGIALVELLASLMKSECTPVFKLSGLVKVYGSHLYNNTVD